jgi:outer membrane protein OmpA-like peptidoglycan-associated protein
VPETTNIINNTVINNTIVNNNTVNNTTIDNSTTEVNVIERVENRTVLEVGDQLIVRGDDRPRLRRDSEEVFYDNLARDRVRETITRPGGVRIVTIYNRYGDIIQRSRVGRDGREYILVYAPELEDDAPRPGLVDVGYELPPMRLRIPVSDYIIDTSSEPDRDFYEFLSEPPVERVERVYSIDEVKHSARLRDKVRRIDLDTITFATGSAEVPMSQARTLRSVAEAMQKVLDKDPGETFLIEGHTDAVGADKPNLVLSDERAESVASLLTEVYGVPPENLQTQGYGERFLKVRTDAAEQQNRRVTIRRVTTLVRPMAKAN